jgi:hypothetical protein
MIIITLKESNNRTKEMSSGRWGSTHRSKNRSPCGFRRPYRSPVRFEEEDPSWRKTLHSSSQLQTLQQQLQEQIAINNEQTEAIAQLEKSLNETREQVQALLDYCFTDRTKWKEGQPKEESKKEETS